MNYKGDDMTDLEDALRNMELALKDLRESLDKVGDNIREAKITLALED